MVKRTLHKKIPAIYAYFIFTRYQRLFILLDCKASQFKSYIHMALLANQIQEDARLSNDDVVNIIDFCNYRA